MRIFYVTGEYIDETTLRPCDGGLASYLVKITAALRAKGHDISVVCCHATKDAVVEWNGIHVHFVSNSNLRRAWWQSLLWRFVSPRCRQRWAYLLLPQKVSKLIRQEHARERVDIIQYASYWSTGILPERSIPSCVRISSYAKLWQKFYGESDPEEVEHEIEQFRKARFLYGPSRFVADAIARDLSLKTKIEIIETPFLPYAGVEDPTCYEELRGRIGEAPYLLFYGTIGLLKGAVEIAAAVGDVLKRHPTLNLVLVGREKPLPDGGSPVAAIRSAAGVDAGRIHWFDRQGHDRLFPLIRHSFGVLLPSRVDNLPNTCIEAMGLGKIVIGSRGASFEQLIEDGKNGFLCAAGDASSIPPAVDRLMSLDPTARQAMEEAAISRSRMLSLESIVPQVETYYRRVVAEW